MNLKSYDYIVGIIDQYDAVHSVVVPWEGGENDDYCLMHGDLFPEYIGLRKWRVVIDTNYKGELMTGRWDWDSAEMTADDKTLVSNHVDRVYNL
jgi:hypothetical protein